MIRLVIHGGAGGWRNMDRERVEKALQASLERGLEILRSDGFAGDAVVEAVKILEDSGVFNAGLGSYLNIEGEREMDAGYGDSLGRAAGVGGVKYPRNPVELAYKVALETDHRLIVGREADRLATKFGLERIGGIPKRVLDKYVELMEERRYVPERNRRLMELFYGDTVGAVALDNNGNLAAAVSTGGLWLKLPGRVGDTPVFGAGFYVSRDYAVCGTGVGEHILYELLSYRAYLEYRETGDIYRSLMVPLEEMGLRWPKSAGLIAVDRYGGTAYYHITDAMVLAYFDGEEERVVISRKT